jgi:pyruvate dehydrogenase E2 component (dihydrolipoamide acetyltransferase)
MVFEFKFADVGEGVHEGEVLEWHVNEGDTVKVEQVLLEVSTEKLNTEITSPVNGTVVSILKGDGETIHVGDVLCTIEESGSGTQKATKSADPTPPAEDDPGLFKASPMKIGKRKREVKPETSEAPLQQTGKIVTERPLAAPAIRRRAREAGIDLRYISGSGPAGRITQTDLDATIESGVTPVATGVKSYEKRVYTPGGHDVVPLKGMRKTIAKSMRKSKDFAAHYSYFEEVNMEAIDKLRGPLKEVATEYGVNVTYPAIIMKMLAPVLRKYPILNSKLVDEADEIHFMHDINIGLSVDTPEGLIVPVVKNVDKKSVVEIAVEINELAQKARSGKLSLDDITGGTFTITSIGNIGGVMATPIIKHPEVAILGLMKATKRPIVVEKDGKDEIVIGKMMYLSLSLDHRVVDGAVGARFINDLIRYMENPGLLYLENTDL